MAYLVSHPIQYQAPLLRRIAKEPDIDLTVFFGSDFSVKGYKDEGFGGVGIKWDVPLLEGYKHHFLPVLRDHARVTPTTPMNYGIASRLRDCGDGTPYDALWVHGYASVNALHAITAANALGIPVLVRAESWLGDRERSAAKLAAKKLFFRTLSQMIDGVLPIGTLNSEYWSYYLGEHVPQFLVPYAVDNEYFQQRSTEAAPRRGELRRELALSPDRPVILFASKLQRRKRADDLLEAYKQLSPAPGQEPHPYLVIVGDGEQREQLERAARQTGFSSIRFCGFRNQSELPRFFDIATVFVLPSRHEPWGLIVNEVMNAGRAVIVSDEVGCQSDLITDGVEGAVFPAGSVEGLADALRRTLVTPETAAEMGRKGLERINRWSFEEDVRGFRQALAAVTKKIAAS
ncbi:glycosyltransferase family 4 protein [Edaphobacter sp. 12200R-103]|uniref:glycosyltransferase family 4 protein n=1 Tax=Edaphobacter sp. 12200R-103 TaxID=2703788 RepID=UPI001EE47D5F|nr:glycosyltransferase family 4 protein [Edaphobacter sp. 12200R-103]